MNVGRYLRGEDRHVGTARTTQPQPPQRKPLTIAWYDPSNGVVSTDQDCPLFTPLGQVWPLYPKGEWIDLTDEDRNDCLVEADPCECLATPEAQELMRCVEAKLKELNHGK